MTKKRRRESRRWGGKEQESWIWKKKGNPAMSFERGKK